MIVLSNLKKTKNNSNLRILLYRVRHPRVRLLIKELNPTDWGPSALHYMAKKPTTRLFCHEFPRQCSERNTKTSQSPVKVTYVWKRFSTFRLVSEKNNHSIVKGRTVLFKTFPLCARTYV